MEPVKQAKIKKSRLSRDVSSLGRSVPSSLEDITHSLAYVPANMLVANAAGIIRYVNPQTLATMGFEQGEMIGQAMTSFWDQSKEISQEIMAQLERDQFWQGEIKQKLKNPGDDQMGNGYWELVSLSMVPGANGTESFITKIGQPVDHGREDELEARLNESKLERQVLMDTTPYAISIYRLSDRRFLDVNRSFCRDTGYTREELLGRTAVELGLYKDLADREAYAKVFERDGRIDDMEIPFITKSGQTIDAVISARRTDFRGEACVITTSRDVTELKKTQRALEESELRYRTILEAAPDPITLTRLSDGKIVHTNSAFYQRTGWRPEDTIGRTTTELNIYANTEDREKFVDILQKEGQVDALQVQVRFKDGTTSYDIWSARVIEILGERHLVVVTRDVGQLLAIQKALVESERNYRTILETSPHPVAVSRLSDSQYILINEAFTRDTGYCRQEVVGQRVQDLNLFENQVDRDSFLKTFQSEGRVDGMELRIIRKDGSITESLISARPIQYGNEPCVLVMATNIDTLKKTQRALSEREANYRTILEMAPYSILITRHSDGVFLEVNQVCCRRIGYSREEIIGSTSYKLNLYPEPADRDRIFETLQREGQVTGMEIRFRAKDGTLLESLVSAASIKYHGEECLLSMVVDITEQKRTQRALEASEKTYRTILDTVPNSVTIARMSDKKYLLVNKAFCERTGHSREEAIGSDSTRLNLYVDRGDRKRLYEMLSQKGLVDSMEVAFQNRKLAITHNLLSARPIEFNGEKCLLSVSTNIDRIKEMQSELEKYHKHLEEMVQERTQALESAQNELVKREKLSVLGHLTATVSHELRNPLGVIRSSNFYLQRKIGTKEDKIDKHFNRIEEQVNLCNLIIADLLEYTRGRRVSLEDSPITPWLEQVIEQLEETKGIAIEKHLSKTLTSIPHDQEKMRRVCINLIENAVQAVRARSEDHNKAENNYQPNVCVTTTQNENSVVIEVRDNGIGMDEKTREHAFEPLFTTRSRGTGIGLANVQKIVSEHNGEISLTSAPGEGTTVSVRLLRKIDAK